MRDVPTVPIRCEHCIDIGLIEFEQTPLNHNPWQRKYRFVKPCTCSASVQWLDTINRVVGYNKLQKARRA